MLPAEKRVCFEGYGVERINLHDHNHRPVYSGRDNSPVRRVRDYFSVRDLAGGEKEKKVKKEVDIMDNAINISAEQLEEINEGFRQIAEWAREIIEKIAEWAREAVNTLAEWIRSLSKEFVSPRVYQLAFFHKKERVRKKNKRRMFETLKRIMAD